MTLAAAARELRAAGVPLRLQEPLSAHTTFRVGGPADIYCEPGSVEGLSSSVQICRQTDVPFFVLGAGSNVLFSDAGRRGVVIATRAVRGIAATSTGLEAAAGEPLSGLIAAAQERGSLSLGFLAGIPGTVGGAAATNAGIPEHSMADILESVAVLDASNRVLTLQRSECGLGYRTSALRGRLLVVLSANIRFGSASFDVEALLARRRATQPIGEASAGCIFRNPIGESAGALIDRAGLKGALVGSAQVSEKHANFIVNRGGATSAEICKLIDIVRQKVYNTHQVSLDLEVEVIDG